MLSKHPALLLIIIMILSSIIVVGTSTASGPLPKPSIPEFTLKYVDRSYEAPSATISTFNQYNNQTTTTTVPGYQVQNLTIDLTIKNQHIPPTIDGNKSYLLFWVRLRGHYSNGDDWIYPFRDAIDAYPRQSNSDYTVISLPTSYNYGANTESLQSLQLGDKIDFQVRAILAYGFNYSLNAFLPIYSYDYKSVATSDWSNTQTLTISENASLQNKITASPTLSNTTALTDDYLIKIVIIALLSAIVAATVMIVIVFFRKRNTPLKH
jgi:hypothetical protein